MAGRRHLLEPEAHEVFQAYGFPVAAFRSARSPEEARVQPPRPWVIPWSWRFVSPQEYMLTKNTTHRSPPFTGQDVLEVLFLGLMLVAVAWPSASG